MGRGPGGGGPIEAIWQRTGDPRQLAVDDGAHRGAGGRSACSATDTWRAMSADSVSMGGSARLGDQLEQHGDVELQPVDDAVGTARTARAVEGEAEVVAADDLEVAGLPVAVHARDVRQEDARLPGTLAPMYQESARG